MGSISFKRITPKESRIYTADGEHVGDVYAHDDILNPGARVFLISLDEDPRGWARVHHRSQIRQVTEQRLRTHPLFP